MGKKKREHIVFDQMLVTKKNIPFSVVNKKCTKKKKNPWERRSNHNEEK